MSLLYSAGKWNVPPAIAGYEPIGIFLSQGIFPSSRETARCPPCQVAAPYSQYSTGRPSQRVLVMSTGAGGRHLFGFTPHSESAEGLV